MVDVTRTNPQFVLVYRACCFNFSLPMDHAQHNGTFVWRFQMENSVCLKFLITMSCCLQKKGWNFIFFCWKELLVFSISSNFFTLFHQNKRSRGFNKHILLNISIHFIQRGQNDIKTKIFFQCPCDCFNQPILIMPNQHLHPQGHHTLP